jgi:hypothetical protein
MFWNRKAERDREREALDRIRALCRQLERPLRFLADLDAIRPKLPDDERRSIEESRPVRDRHHEQLAESLVQELEIEAMVLRSRARRPVRDAVLAFTRSWRHEEPDRLKVIESMIPKDAA